MKDNLEKYFKEKNREFDFAEPDIGHFERFEAKLKGSKHISVEAKGIKWHWMAVAASILLLVGFWLGNNNGQKGLELADVSPKMEETQNFYLATIQKEIEEIRGQKTPENNKIITDAFAQLEILELNYQKLRVELKESNEDKRVIYAMIANFQQRLEVLQNLVVQLEEFKKYENLEPAEKIV